MSKTITKYFIVSGRVQRVWFRSSTQSEARKLGLTGWVRNREDGSVEVLACGPEEKIQQLETWLWKGPIAAKVDNVQSETINTIETFMTFETRK